MIKICIVEDDQAIRESLFTFLKAQDDFACESVFESIEGFLVWATEKREKPDVLLLDIELPGINGIDGIPLIRKACPDIDILMLTIYHDSDKIFRSLCMGATGYLLKNTPLNELRDHIHAVHTGGSPMSPQIARKVIEYFGQGGKKPLPPVLTEREREIMQALDKGFSYKMIAHECNISIDTVRFHIRNIYRKLQVSSRSEILTKYLRS